MEKLIAQLNALDLKLSSIGFANALISYDALTQAPKKAVNARAQAMEGLSTFYYDAFITPEVKSLLDTLHEHLEELDHATKGKVRVLRDQYESLACIPAQEYAAFHALVAKSSVAWEEAKEKSDFSIFAQLLEQVISSTKKFIDYRGKDIPRYDQMLDDYEKGLTMAKADVFFDELRETIVPLLKRIQEEGMDIQKDFLDMSYDKAGQKAFSEFMMEALGFRMDAGILGESVHPFTINMSRDDVRITTRYQENEMISTIASTIHETGHALYEQNVDEDYGLSCIATGTSMGIHESQSRMFENNFGRSKAFWSQYLPKLKEQFPKQLQNVSLEAFYKAINVVTPSLIRVDADELTYSLHIMIRYEMEKRIMGEDLDVNELPKIWNDLYEAYIGIRPENDGEGILQDVHWSEGLMGYFPSYALGSAYAVQFVNAMSKEVDIDQALEDGDFKPINAWLEKHIHRFGSTKTPEEILLDATGEPFNPKYYSDYLVNKFSSVYGLS